MRFRVTCDWASGESEQTLTEIVANVTTGAVGQDERKLLCDLIMSEVGQTVDILEPFNGLEHFTRIE